MKKKTVTLADIAQNVGVSVNAVSLALRGKNGVSKQMRKRIVQAAGEMGYSSVSSQKANILALIPQRFVFTDYASPGSTFYQQLCFEMESFATSQGHHLILSRVPPEDEKAARTPPILSAVPIAAIITVGNLSQDYCRMIQSLGRPYVMADQYYDGVPASSVITANTAGAYALTSYLISKGHREIQFFGAPLRTSSLEDRWVGYQRAMRDHGLTPPDNEMLHWRDPEHDDGILVPRVLDGLDSLPSAFVCGHDSTARAVIELMARRGLRCPDDFSITGFDNIQSPEILKLRLTTCDTPKKSIAETAVRLALDGSAAPRRIQLYGEIVIRDSAKAIRGE